MESLKEILSKNSFLRNSSYLVSGTVISQLVNIAISPILTRLYDPVSFGELAIFISCINIFIVVATLRLELAIPLPKTDKDSFSVVYISFIILIIFSFLFFITLTLLPLKAYSFFGLKEIFDFRYLLVIGVLSIGTYQILNYWTTRKEKFQILAWTKAYQTISMGAAQLISGFLKFGSLGLIIGYILGKATGIFSLFKSSNFPSLQVVKYSNLKENFLKYKNFPLYTTWASLTNVLGTQSPPILLNLLFTVDIAGLFSLTIRIMMLPIHFIGQAIGQVVYPRLAKIKNTDNFSDNVLKLSVVLTIISIPIFLSLHFLAEDLFAYIFGEEWRVSGVYAKYISIWLLVSFISSPLSTLVFIKNKQRMALSITVYETVLRIGSLYLGFYLGSALLSIILYSISGFIITSIYIVWIFKITDSSILKYFKILKITFLKYSLITAGIYALNFNYIVISVLIISAVIHEVYYYKSKVKLL